MVCAFHTLVCFYHFRFRGRFIMYLSCVFYFNVFVYFYRSAFMYIIFYGSALLYRYLTFIVIGTF